MRALKHFYLRLLATVVLTTVSVVSNAQSVGISTTTITPNGESILELRATDKGLLVPRMTTAQRGTLITDGGTFTGDANAGAGLGLNEKGMTVFNTSTNLYNYWDGTQWVEMQTVASTTGTFIENQSTADQSASFRISGNGTIQTALGVGAIASGATSRVLIHDASGTAGELQLLVRDNASLPILAVEDVGRVGIGTSAPAASLEVLRQSGGDAFNVRLIKNSNTASELVGIGMGSQVGQHIVKSAVVHERESANGTGKLHFLVDDATDANDVALAQARMTIDRNGLVGIGTTSPTQELSIENSGVSDATILFRTDDGTTASTAYDAASLEAGWESTETAWNEAFIKFNTHPTNTNTLSSAMIVKGPDVGIGTTDPLARLQVTGGRVEFTNTDDASGTVNSGVLEIANSLRIDGNEMITNTGTTLYLQNDNGGNLQVDGGTLFADATNNRIGIGTTAPAQALHIDGETDFRVDVSDATYIQAGNFYSSADNMSLESMGDIQVVIDENNNDNNKAFYVKRNSTTATGNDIVAEFNEGGWLKVGNPSTPGGTSGTQWNITYWEEFDNYSYWTQSNGCSGTGWFIPFFSGGYIYYEHSNNNDDDYAYTPYIWIPSNADPNNIRARWNMWVCMESSWDGVRAEYSINNGAWTVVPNAAYTSGGPNSDADNGCGGGHTAAWSGGTWSTFGGDNPLYFSPVLDLDYLGVHPGDWVELRLEASTDGSHEECTDDVEIYWFTVEVINQTNSAAFEYGGVYASGHIFAHSNSHVGDVAEYFPVNGPSEAGDLIAMDPNKPDSYLVSNSAYNPYVIGVYSTDPSVLVNSPDAGEPVGLSGRVPVKVTSEGGDIKIGDYLTSSSTKGHAMKAEKAGYTIGRALENMDEETGTILCLIEPGWYNPSGNSNTSGGTFFIGEGETSVVVSDPSMIRDSRVFVSMLGNPGSQFWISEKENGRFEISLDKPATSEVRFDFLIDNAKQTTFDSDRPSAIAEVLQTEATKTENEHHGNDVLVDVDGKKLTLAQINNTSPKEPEGHNKAQGMTERDDAKWNLPSPPPDPEKSWIWHPDHGYVETGKGSH